MTLSVVILNYNVRYFLELCLSSVQQAIQGIDAEIIVVDNNSCDDSCEMVREKFPKVKLIQNKENFGFAKGNNIGVGAAKGEFICILNPDTVIPEHIFRDMLSFAEDKPKLGALGCRLIDGSGKFLPESKRNLPTIKIALGKLMGSSKGYYADQLTNDATGRVDILVGAFIFMRRSVYREAGGFDEAYFMYGEDIDLSYSLQKLGYENWYKGDLKVIHYKGESSPKDRTYLKRFYGAMLVFYKKHFRPNMLFSLAVKIGLFLLSRIDHVKPEREFTVERVVYFGTEIPEGLQTTLDISKSQNLVKLVPATKAVYDTKDQSFAAIINHFEEHAATEDLHLLIRPADAPFIIGSYDRYRPGTVEIWG